MSFTHLHLHTEYSLLDGLNRIPDLVNKVKRMGMDSVAMTDHGTLLGLHPFWSECTSQGIKPIIGCEVYVAREHRTDRQSIEGKKSPYHMILLAATQEGYHNLVKLVSRGHLEGFYRKPRVDRELLEKYRKGIICLSACVSGEVPRNIINGDMEKAIKSAQYFQDLFGRENYYIELQRNGYHVQEQINPSLLKVAQAVNAPIVATCDSHYLDKGDGALQEIVWCIADGRKITDETRRLSYGEEFYVKSGEEMNTLFADLPLAISNTKKIADSIEKITIKFDRIIPKFWGDLGGKDPADVLREQAYEGAKKKYPEMTDALRERIDYELEIIHTKGYDDYFLIVGDLMRWARSNNIIVGVRGSAGGSVIAYCLEIINIEPIGWNCYFERFLNPERPSPPDIDIDLQDDRRDEVVNYIAQKYGDGFSAICALGRLKTKAAIKDVGRVLGIELSLVEKLSKMVHVKFGKVKKIKDMMHDDKEFAAIVNGDKRLKELERIVQKIEGMTRHISTHACGFLITPSAITNYIPVQMETGARNRVITQIEGDQLEDLGFMKFDFLGLRNLTIINNVLKLVNDNKSEGQEDLTTETIPLDDAKTFKTFSAGKTTGVFQFESSGMKKYLKDLKPTTLEDICFMAAAYRPGPMQFISGYIDCKYGRKQPEYLVPELEDIVGVTYGYAIYQEQVIKITVDIAGYSMGEADLLRRAMGKKKIAIMNQEEPKFKKGVMAKGHSKQIADKLWAYLLPFADYGFNKAHAAGYALIGYWTAYLKTHFPIEFIAGLIQSDVNDNDRLAIDMDECHNMGIEILPPHVNESDILFKIIKRDDGTQAIRFGLLAIRNFGSKIAEALIEERNKNGSFESFEDLLTRIKHKDLNKKSIEALAKAGALGDFCEVSTVLHNIDTILGFVKDEQKRAASNQGDLFSGLSDMNIAVQLRLDKVPDATKKQILMWEKEYLNCYISGHPFRSIEDYFKEVAIPYSQLINFDERLLKVVGQISAIKKIITKKGDPMLFVRIENTRETMEIIVFPRTYEKTIDLWQQDMPILIEGKVSVDGAEFSLLCSKAILINQNNIEELAMDFKRVTPEKPRYYKKKDEIKKPLSCYLELENIPNQDILLKLKDIFSNNPGLSPVFLQIGDKKVATKATITLSQEIKDAIELLIGANNVVWKK